MKKSSAIITTLVVLLLLQLTMLIIIVNKNISAAEQLGEDIHEEIPESVGIETRKGINEKEFETVVIQESTKKETSEYLSEVKSKFTDTIAWEMVGREILTSFENNKKSMHLMNMGGNFGITYILDNPPQDNFKMAEELIKKLYPNDFDVVLDKFKDLKNRELGYVDSGIIDNKMYILENGTPGDIPTAQLVIYKDYEISGNTNYMNLITPKYKNIIKTTDGNKLSYLENDLGGLYITSLNNGIPENKIVEVGSELINYKTSEIRLVISTIGEISETYKEVLNYSLSKFYTNNYNELQERYTEIYNEEFTNKIVEHGVVDGRRYLIIKDKVDEKISTEIYIYTK